MGKGKGRPVSLTSSSPQSTPSAAKKEGDGVGKGKGRPVSLTSSSPQSTPSAAKNEGDGVGKGKGRPVSLTSSSPQSTPSAAKNEGDGVGKGKGRPVSLTSYGPRSVAKKEGDGVGKGKGRPVSLTSSSPQSTPSVAKKEGDGVGKGKGRPVSLTSSSPQSTPSVAKNEGDGVGKGKGRPVSLTSSSPQSTPSAAKNEGDGVGKGKGRPVSLTSSSPQSTPSAAKNEGDGVVDVSSSPVKDDPNRWLPHLHLSLRDKSILESSQWLNDGLINAAQTLLQAKTENRIFGFQSTQLSKREGLFVHVPPNRPFIQVLHVAKCHWLTTSNVNVHGGACYKDIIGVYDSGRPNAVSGEITNSVCSFFKCTSDVIRFDIMNVIPQPNVNDCGVHAIAHATELAHGADPVTCNWDMGQMRKHLLSCLESGVMTRFPKGGQRRVRFGTRVRKSFPFDLFCICRVNDDSKSMIECVRCLKWYHKECMALDDEKSYSSVKWMCTECNSILSDAKP